MIVRISIFDTIINLYKPRISGNCIKFVSKLQFLTFCSRVKIKKELNLSDLAFSLCCLGRIRTLTGGTRIRRATITPQGNLLKEVLNVVLFNVCKGRVFLRYVQIFWAFF